MAKHIGIVGCSAEGAALCYRTICSEGSKLMGKHNHPEVSMHTYPLSDYMKGLTTDDWSIVSDLMLATVKKLSDIGADFAICPDNTIHEVFDTVEENSPIPWLHIVDAVANEAVKKNFKKLGILGTEYLMVGPVYSEILKKHDLENLIPKEEDRKKINYIIFDELNNGVFSEESRLYFNEVIEKLKNDGCDAVVLGCTEIPLLVDPNDCPLPTLDSTRLLAKAALKEALS